MSDLNTLSSKLEPGESERARSRDLQLRAHKAIPGGCHTYAKGDDQYPVNAPAFIARGQGCHVWDVEGREYIEFALGLRSTTLGHCWPSVVAAATDALQLGNNFNRPHELEVQCAEMLLELIPGADMVKFTKDGSSVMTAAVKLARAATGRTRIAMCNDSPFYSYDDWFIGKTAVDTGVPEAIKNLSVGFDYNDLGSLESLFDSYPCDIACVVMEPSRLIEPAEGFLEGVRRVCSQHGAVLIFDETLTGFRVHLNGAQQLYGVTPDLSCFGKAMANGFSLSALAGKRELMELGGLKQTTADRVFLLSTTHGAESVALAAAIETMRIYRDEPVIEHLYDMGRRLRVGFKQAAEAAGVEKYVTIAGRDCNLMYSTTDRDGMPSQALRTLFLQELCGAGVLAPTFYTCYAHQTADIEQTTVALESACKVYRRALDEGVEHFLHGPASQSAYRKRN
ncbi:glutamate-1-semialdehyde 2,1-aminomutase [Granulosicoccus sp. 3-233]|uniref:glutamate-1-semialdehyde 2,1-aminomutase n=1 Tax=Granulosicoccus sp. 3-233 TaxID=3417969 RepID=UPI003D357858